MYRIPFGEEVISMSYSDDWDSGSGDGAGFDNDGGNGE